MTHIPEDDEPQELSYEDFDDVAWNEPGELGPIDLDVLDDEIEPSPKKAKTDDKPSAESKGTADLLDVLDDEIKPAPAVEVKKPPTKKKKQPKAARRETKPPKAETAPVEPASTTDKLLDTLDDEIDATKTPVAESEPAPPPTPEPEQAVPIPERDQPVPAPEPEQAVPISEREQPVLTPEPEAAAPPQEKTAVSTGETAAAAPPVEAPPAPAVYRVLIPLPPDLGAQVLALRVVGEINDMPPPGIELAVPFHTDRLDGVDTVLRDWARAHLPIQFERTGIVAQVIGAQQYIAAWDLEPEEELREAQVELVRALVPLITPVPGKPARARVRIVIGDTIAPGPYPRVIGQMQREFEPYVWHADSVSLFQTTETDAWAVHKTYD